jgi:hypothetical protein
LGSASRFKADARRSRGGVAWVAVDAFAVSTADASHACADVPRYSGARTAAVDIVGEAMPSRSALAAPLARRALVAAPPNLLHQHRGTRRAGRVVVFILTVEDAALVLPAAPLVQAGRAESRHRICTALAVLAIVCGVAASPRDAARGAVLVVDHPIALPAVVDAGPRIQIPLAPPVRLPQPRVCVRPVRALRSCGNVREIGRAHV